MSLLLAPVGLEPVAIMENPSGFNINFILNSSDNGPLDYILMGKEIKYPGYTHVALEITDIESVSLE